jgi:hypothetical protein
MMTLHNDLAVCVAPLTLGRSTSTPKIQIYIIFRFWIDDETREPDNRQPPREAHPSRARLGRARLIFDRDALRASARLLQDTILVTYYIVTGCSPLPHP